jgi:hypothetical protein
MLMGRPAFSQDGPIGLISFEIAFVTKPLNLLVLRLIPSAIGAGAWASPAWRPGHRLNLVRLLTFQK